MNAPRPTIRVDKWLWYARFFKTRGMAAKLVTGAHLRVNGARVAKAAHGIGPGDVLTFPQGRRIRVIEVADIGVRRGPAPEAQALYIDRAPPTPAPETETKAAPRAGAAPSKRERRGAARLKPSGLE